MFFDYFVYAYLRMVFMGPAKMIAKGDELEKFTKQFKVPTICKP